MNPLTGNSIKSETSYELKPRNIRLIPKGCLVVSLKRNPNSHPHHYTNTTNLFSSNSSSTTPLSSLSISSSNEQQNCKTSSNDSKCSSTSFGASSSCTQSITCHDQSQQQHHTRHRDSFTCMCSCQTTTSNPLNYNELFNELMKENAMCHNSTNNNSIASYTNGRNATSSSTTSTSVQHHVQNPFNEIQMIGFVHPGVLVLTSNHQECLDKLCSLWSKRILKAPIGYMITFVGYTTFLEVATISQSHFTPLTEALYMCIDELQSRRIESTIETIMKKLSQEFPCMELPSEDILRSTLNTMIIENKLKYDCVKQVYKISNNNNGIVNGNHRNNDDYNMMAESLENLSVSDQSKNYKDDELDSAEYPQFEEQLNSFDKCKTISTKSSTIITDHDDCSLDSSIVNGNNKIHNNEKTKNKPPLMRRNSSSFSNDETTDVSYSNSMGNGKQQSLKQNFTSQKTGFRRTKSFKLNHKSSENDPSATRNLIERPGNTSCTCSPEMIIKRQSLLGKLFKLNSKQQGRSSSVSSPTSQSSFASNSNNQQSNSHQDFGSQFPEPQPEEQEENNSSLVKYHNGLLEPEEDRYSTRGTQTVKSGPEEVITVVMRHAVGKHTLSRRRNKSERISEQPENCCYPASNRHLHPLVNRSMNGHFSHHQHHHRRNSSCCCEIRQTFNGNIGRKSRHRHNHSSSQNSTSSSNECPKCSNVDSPIEFTRNHCRADVGVMKHRHRLRHTSSSSSSMRNNHRSVRPHDLIEYLPKTFQTCQQNNKLAVTSHSNGIDDLNPRGRKQNNNFTSVTTNEQATNNNHFLVDDKCCLVKKLFNNQNDATMITAMMHPITNNHHHNRIAKSGTSAFTTTNEYYPGNMIKNTNNDNNETDDNNENDDEDEDDYHGDDNNQSKLRKSWVYDLQQKDKLESLRHNHHHNHQQQPNSLLFVDNVLQQQQRNLKQDYNRPTANHNGKVLINNSLSVKIEIETSNRIPQTTSVKCNNELQQPQQQDDNGVDLLTINPVDYQKKNFILSNISHPPQNEHDDCFILSNKQHQDLSPPLFTNDTYSKFDCVQIDEQKKIGNHHRLMIINDLDTKKTTTTTTTRKYIRHPPELNYANSVTALKEQIARAKANFFKESYAS